MSALCHEPTYAVQQTVMLFDHLVGNGEERRRHGEAKHPGGLEVDHQLEFCRLQDRHFCVASGLSRSRLHRSHS
jgi:hypothetical protein